MAQIEPLYMGGPRIGAGLPGKDSIGMPLYAPGPKPVGAFEEYGRTGRGGSPLRQSSHSPNVRIAQPQFENSFVGRVPRNGPFQEAMLGTESRQFRERKISLDRERSLSGAKRTGIIPIAPERISPYKPAPVDLPPPILRKSHEHPIEMAYRVDELLKEIETLKIERDAFENEAKIERAKNQELEEEFHVLRNLIQENTRPIGIEENLLLKSQYHQEREMRITCEQDVNRLRQQLADALAGSHRDTLNLKKALTDMQQTNAQCLQTIYEKGDQNLQQMQQLEDLSKIIREKDAEIEKLNQDVEDLKSQCRDLHNEIRTVKQEAAVVAGERGNALLLNSSMKDKMLDNPRFRKIVENQERVEMENAMKKNP